MNETRIFADAYQTTFADPKEMLEFLAQRAKESSWIRKPTRTLRLVPAIQEAGKMKDTVGKNWEEILEDTENNTQLALKIKGETYPVRTCAIRTILDRAGISGSGLRKLETANYAKVVNYCLNEMPAEDLTMEEMGISVEESLELKYREELLLKEADGDYPKWDEMKDQKLVEALLLLREDERKLIYQHVFEERTFDDMSRINGLSPYKVKGIYYYAIRKIRKWMGGAR